MDFEPRDVIIEKWIERLENGNLEQAQCFLRLDDGYCCLGVLCEVAGYVGEPSQFNGGTVYSFGNQKKALPRDLGKHLGLSGGVGLFFNPENPEGSCPIEFNGHSYVSLANMNDGMTIDPNEGDEYKLTLKQIGQVIRENKDKIFRPMTP